MQYGNFIDSEYSPTKSTVYGMFVTHFGNPEMRKLKDVDSFSIYACKIYTNLVYMYKYVMAFIPRNTHPKDHVLKLSDCNWVNIQMRILEDKHDLPNLAIVPSRKSPLFNVKITAQEENSDYSLYTSKDLPVKIVLLQNKDRPRMFQKEGNLGSAVETFQTIVDFV